MVEVHVLSFPPAPTAPRHLTVVGSTSTSVDLNWIPPLHPNGVIHYEIEYSTSENFVQNETINNTGSNKTHYVLSGLTPGIQYYVRVTARNSAGAKSSNVLSGISFNGMCTVTQLCEFAFNGIIFHLSLFLIALIGDDDLG